MADNELWESIGALTAMMRKRERTPEEVLRDANEYIRELYTFMALEDGNEYQLRDYAEPFANVLCGLMVVLSQCVSDPKEYLEKYAQARMGWMI
jgi:hypothetical protein